MINRLVRIVDDRLQSRGFPVTVQHGPDVVSRHVFDNYVVFERAIGVRDTFESAAGASRNPRRYLTRKVPIRVRVRVSSPLLGVNAGLHDSELDAILNGVLAATAEAVQLLGAAGALEIVEGGMSDEGDSRARGSTAAGPLYEGQYPRAVGASYEFIFLLAYGVDERKYDGSSRPTGAPDSIQNTTLIQVDGGSQESI